MKAPAPLVLVSVLLALTGCTSTSYTDPSGATFSRISIFNQQSVGDVVFKDGQKSLAIHAYVSDQATVAGNVVSAAVTAALSAKNPSTP